jgi:hypothetical protein
MDRVQFHLSFIWVGKWKLVGTLKVYLVLELCISQSF